METARSEIGMILVMARAVLSEMFGAKCADVVWAALVTNPTAFVLAVISAVAFPPFSRVPTFQLRELPWSVKEPWLNNAERKLTPAGKISITLTLAACCGPA